MSTYPTNSFIPDQIAALADPLPRKAAKVSPVPIDDSDLKVAKALAEKGKLDEAYAIYHAIYKAGLAEPSSVQAAKQADKALRRIGDLAFNYLLIGHFEEALRCVDEALSAHPKSVNLAIRRAHALMFLGHVGEARAIYRRYIGTHLAHGRSCNGLIQGDFWDLSDAGYPPPLMDEIERRMSPYYVDEDPADDVESFVETVKPAAEPVQTLIAATRPIDIELGDQFLGEGKLEDALISYRRALTSCKGRMAEGDDDSQAQADFDLAVSTIGGLAFHFLLNKSPEQALDTIKEAMSYRPDWVWLRKIQAYALMLNARITEARNVHRQNCDQILENGEAWGDSIRADFEALRTAGFKLPIMDSIERDFASKI